MSLLFTVCGRAGSKGIVGKNCANFLGVPLVYYTLAVIELFRERHLEVDVVVALNTDSDRLKEIVAASGVDYVFVSRDVSLAGDAVSKVDVIKATMNGLRDSGYTFDYVVDLDITSPLRTVSDLERLLEKRTESDADTVFTIVSSRRNPYFNMVADDGSGKLKRVVESDYLARQQAPRTYDMNASMYAYTNGFLESGRQIFEGSCEGVLMRDTAVLDIDNPDDLELMQVVANWLFSVNTDYAEVDLKAKELFKARW